MDTAAYLDRMLEPVSECFTSEAARRLLQIRADPELQARIDELADRCTEEQLTEDERKGFLAFWTEVAAVLARTMK